MYKIQIRKNIIDPSYPEHFLVEEIFYQEISNLDLAYQLWFSFGLNLGLRAADPSATIELYKKHLQDKPSNKPAIIWLSNYRIILYTS